MATKGLDGKFLHYGIRQEDLELNYENVPAAAGVRVAEKAPGQAATLPLLKFGEE